MERLPSKCNLGEGFCPPPCPLPKGQPLSPLRRTAPLKGEPKATLQSGSTPDSSPERGALGGYEGEGDGVWMEEGGRRLE